MHIFLEYLFTDPRFFFAVAFLVVFSICCHEFMHARIALREGDPTAADRGHLTLNPLRQMGWLSLVMFCFLGIAWGQVPVNHRRMRRRYSPALVAFSGPAANLALAVIFPVLAFLCLKNQLGSEFTWQMLYYGGALNVVLFVLNLLPVPGFDGWWILTNFFPGIALTNSEWVKGAFLVVVILVFTFIDRLFQLGGAVVSGILTLLQFIFG